MLQINKRYKNKDEKFISSEALSQLGAEKIALLPKPDGH